MTGTAPRTTAGDTPLQAHGARDTLRDARPHPLARNPDRGHPPTAPEQQRAEQPSLTTAQAGKPAPQGRRHPRTAGAHSRAHGHGRDTPQPRHPAPGQPVRQAQASGHRRGRAQPAQTLHPVNVPYKKPLHTPNVGITRPPSLAVSTSFYQSQTLLNSPRLPTAEGGSGECMVGTHLLALE
ncbi:MAG: hypothetical protein D6694_00830 [Gammaproteobacteria bacterium]|nr:MAG: hypothetical protein D6694_00830 [Gammaproteobacteria bacterium]